MYIKDFPESAHGIFSGQGRDETTKSSDFTIKAPKINLPNGGGHIKGIGEKSAANPVIVTGSMSVPIATITGRSGFGPQLSLSYDSGSGNGPWGMDWSLPLPSITFKTDKGLPHYNDAKDSDEFILSGDENLVPVFKKDNITTWFGKSEESRILAIGNKERIFSWLICKAMMIKAMRLSTNINRKIPIESLKVKWCSKNISK